MNEINDIDIKECKITHCEKCQKTNFCGKCSSNYILNDGECYPESCNIKNCKKCDEKNVCSNCKDNYKLNETNNSCENLCLDSNCLQCLLNNICLLCEENYTSTGYSCVKKCEDPFCSYCSEYNICETCSSGYYIKNNKCVECSDKNCSICNNDTCLKCKSGYSFINDKCINSCENIKNCEYCINNSSKCVKCKKDCKLTKKYTCNCNNEIPLFLIAFIFIIFMFIIFVSCIIYFKRKNVHDQLVNNELIISRRRGRRNNYQTELSDLNSNQQFKNSLREKYKEEFNENYVETQDKDFLGLCDYCKIKKAKFIVDCGCSLCEEHCIIQNNNEQFNLNFHSDRCPVCNKIITKKNIKKGKCGICLQNKITLKHFKCNCALFVCRECYVKCKLQSNKCPACRNDIS